MIKLNVGIGRCRKCGKIINVGQFIPIECAQTELTAPFRNLRGVEEYRKTGWCQSCTDLVYGEED